MRRAVVVVLLALALAGAGCGLPPLVEERDWGCGFVLAGGGQTVGLFVDLADFRDCYRRPLPEVTVLPDPLWQAEVRIGHDLFATGSATPSEPSPVVDEVWPVVAGTITILELPGIEDCGPARALLEGFEALKPDGTRVYLGDLEAHTKWWGCRKQ